MAPIEKVYARYRRRVWLPILVQLLALLGAALTSIHSPLWYIGMAVLTLGSVVAWGVCARTALQDLERELKILEVEKAIDGSPLSGDAKDIALRAALETLQRAAVRRMPHRAQSENVWRWDVRTVRRK